MKGERRMMPNVGGLGAKRPALCAALQNVILYGAPIWIEALKIESRIGLQNCFGSGAPGDHCHQARGPHDA